MVWRVWSWKYVYFKFLKHMKYSSDLVTWPWSSDCPNEFSLSRKSRDSRITWPHSIRKVTHEIGRKTSRPYRIRNVTPKMHVATHSCMLFPDVSRVEWLKTQQISLYMGDLWREWTLSRCGSSWVRGWYKSLSYREEPVLDPTRDLEKNMSTLSGLITVKSI